MSVLDQLKDLENKSNQLEEQKKQLLNKAKDELIAQINPLIDQLNSLGHNYKLSGGPAAPGKRRSGIRADVLNIIKKAQNGINRSDILATLNAKGDKSAEQSVSNALSALKKQGAVTADDGNYTA